MAPTKALLTLWLFSMVFPIGAYWVIRLFPQASLNRVGGCRQVRAPHDIIATAEYPVCACIIGATTGIGRELSELLGNKTGVRLIVTGRTKERVDDSLRDVSESVILSKGLDLEDDSSILGFNEELQSTVNSHCHGRLDYLFLNAGQGYSDDYQGPFTSRDGKYDRLFAGNFLGYITLLSELKNRIIMSSTRVVFVSSVAHYTGNVADLFTPNLFKKTTSAQKMEAYCTSKLALSMLQQIAAKDGFLRNSVAVTCGAALTSFGLNPQDRANLTSALSLAQGSSRSWLEHRLQLTARQGAEVILDAALLRKDEVKPGEFVLPYFYGFSWLANSETMPRTILPKSWKIFLNIAYEHLFQKMTYAKKHVWICPASVESKDQSLQRRLKETYMQRL